MRTSDAWHYIWFKCRFLRICHWAATMQSTWYIVNLMSHESDPWHFVLFTSSAKHPMNLWDQSFLNDSRMESSTQWWCINSKPIPGFDMRSFLTLILIFHLTATPKCLDHSLQGPMWPSKTDRCSRHWSILHPDALSDLGVLDHPAFCWGHWGDTEADLSQDITVVYFLPFFAIGCSPRGGFLKRSRVWISVVPPAWMWLVRGRFSSWSDLITTMLLISITEGLIFRFCDGKQAKRADLRQIKFIKVNYLTSEREENCYSSVKVALFCSWWVGLLTSFSKFNFTD